MRTRSGDRHPVDDLVFVRAEPIAVHHEAGPRSAGHRAERSTPGSVLRSAGGAEPVRSGVSGQDAAASRVEMRSVGTQGEVGRVGPALRHRCRGTAGR